MPPYAGIFVQLTFLNTLVEILLNSNETLNRASGKNRQIQIIISVDPTTNSHCFLHSA